MPKRTALFLAMAVMSSLSFAGDIPDVRVGPFTFTDVPIHHALTEIVKGTGVSVVMADEIPGVLTAVNVSGKLDVIVGKMCAYAEARCDFEDGAIVVAARGKTEPPVAAAPSALPQPSPVAAVQPLPAVVPDTSDDPAALPSGPANAPSLPVVPVPVVALADVASSDMESFRPGDLHKPASEPALEVFVRNGESLRTALAREAAKMQLKLSWSLHEDRVASRDMTFTGPSRDDVLNDILIAFRLPGYLVESTNTLYIVKDPK